jgi:hypothetical protein
MTEYQDAFLASQFERVEVICKMDVSWWEGVGAKLSAMEIMRSKIIACTLAKKTTCTAVTL